MRKWTANAIFSIVLLPGAAGMAWAQQQDDLDVTMSVVPANATGAGALSEIKLPDAASDRGRDAAAFGQSTASKARDMKGDLGRDFGQSVSEAARGKGNSSNPPGKGKGN
jgi:hypothetical protein